MFFGQFLEGFWRHFGVPDPRKLSSRLHGVLIFIKSVYFGSGSILMGFGQVFEGVLTLKSMRKSIEKIIKMLIDFLKVF